MSKDKRRPPARPKPTRTRRPPVDPQFAKADGYAGRQTIRVKPVNVDLDPELMADLRDTGDCPVIWAVS